MTYFSTRLVIVATFISLIGCGGGGGGNNSSSSGSDQSVTPTPVEDDNTSNEQEGLCEVQSNAIALEHGDSCVVGEALFTQYNLDSQNILQAGQDISCDDSVIRSANLSVGGLNINGLSITCASDPDAQTNSLPVIDSVQDISTFQGETVSINVGVNDADGDNISLEVSGLPNSLTLSVTNTGWEISGHLTAEDLGTHFITISAQDGEGSVSESFQINVSIATASRPNFVSVDGDMIINLPNDFKVSEGESLVLQVQASDAENDDMTISFSSNLNFARLENIENGIANLIFEPSFTDAGVYSVGLVVSDRHGSSSLSVNVDIEQAYSGDIRAITNGDFHSCVIDSGDVECWGLNESLRSGVSDQLSNITMIAAGGYFTCAGNSSGVGCWGSTSDGEGDVPSISGGVTKIVAGQDFACALASNTVYCWGGESDIIVNQVGQADVPADLGSVKDISAGHRHACALLSDDSIRCWGTNTYGESSPPVLSFTPSSLDLGRNRSCATDGENIACWGISQGYSSNTPPATIQNLEQLDIGNETVSCALASGDIQCWGDGGNDIDSRNELNRKAIPNDLGDVSAMSVGDTHVCAVTDSGVRCWGAGEAGETGSYDFEQGVVPAFLTAD